MERRIRRLGIFIVLCFLALFIQLNNIQVFKANSLATDPNNPRVQAVARSQTRGSILSVDGTVLASSVLAPPGSVDKYQRVYNPNTATLFAQIIGFDSVKYGNFRGIEAEYNNYLTPHTPPARNLRDLLTNRTQVDNVTLTVNENLQLQVAAALNQGTAQGVNGAAAVVWNPTNGNIEAMYSNPSFDPNPLVSPNLTTEQYAWETYLAQPGNPLVSGTYDALYPPGSSFKVVTTSAVLQHRPDLATMTYPSRTSIPLPDTGNPPQVLTNYHSEACPANGPGTLEELVIESCDADFAYIGFALGGPTLLQQAEAYGFNQTIPLDVPADTVAASTMLAPNESTAAFDADIPGVMKSAIGQENVAATALQMAMVAGTVANGGVEMTPHLMSYIDDSQGDRVETFQPKPWMVPISPQTASTLTTFMQGVTKSGTAAGVFPASWDVAAKTGTAQAGSFGPDPAFTDDWLIAFAPVGNTKVAIAVVLPNQPGSATGAKFSGPIVEQILQDVRTDQGQP
jgi:penicillin-binding protein A